jgi:hypothetical protein
MSIFATLKSVLARGAVDDETHVVSLNIVEVRAIARAADHIDLLERALSGLIERYVDLINSGDCGNWDPESEDPVKAARAALDGKREAA